MFIEKAVWKRVSQGGVRRGVRWTIFQNIFGSWFERVLIISDHFRSIFDTFSDRVRNIFGICPGRFFGAFFVI